MLQSQLIRLEPMAVSTSPTPSPFNAKFPTVLIEAANNYA